MFFVAIGLVFAANEYSFDLQYTGNVIKNVEKNANVLLIGVNGTSYSNVLIKVNITGPATPKLLATDSSGTEYDIAQLGSWGPPSGFAVQGDFTNTTQIKATFSEAGNYTIQLSLVDVSNNNLLITNKVFTINVLEEEPSIDDNEQPPVEDEEVEELPKTGTSILEYVSYVIVFGTILTVSIIYINRKRIPKEI